ncbi:MAG TPA: 2,3-diphosphoglycerate-dependent phosphoglycerate mutase, partial [Oceanicaulis sp.]|nr:2,3-diphosphoglycerate-dependent phosphoglycerate mutase [Oceanicaulis sp.]
DRYAKLDPALLPGTESLKLTLDRVAPYFHNTIAPKIKAGEDILISAHGNSLRALIKMLFDVSADDIVKVEVPTGNPLMVELDGLKPTSARYLDEDRAQPLSFAD